MNHKRSMESDSRKLLLAVIYMSVFVFLLFALAPNNMVTAGSVDQISIQSTISKI